VREDTAYQDACRNSDEENSQLECESAVKRVMDSYGTGDVELYRAFYESDTFRDRLNEYVFGMTYAPLVRSFAESEDEHIPVQNKTIALFPVGDFYEAYGEDARIIADILSLTLTTRRAGAEETILCGFPSHTLDEYAARLAESGYMFSVMETVPESASSTQTDNFTRPETTNAFYNPEHEDLYIRETLLNGTGYVGGKSRVYDFLRNEGLTGSAIASFLRAEYGTGGWTMNFSDGAAGNAVINNSGIQIRFGVDENAPIIKLSWAHTGGLLSNLVDSGEYFTPEQDVEMPAVNEQISLLDLMNGTPDYREQATEYSGTTTEIFDEPNKPEPPVRLIPVEQPKPPNFQITQDIDIGGGGAKTKYRRNIEAIRLSKTIEFEERYATPEEQTQLALYSGWGGIP
jgi:hypothetical protein